jgi:NTP pyrophosphatase (non-canonical NTP hydrolase)
MDTRGATIEALTEAVVSFRDARDWKQFHDPKDVCISLSLEASELLEIFQWARDSSEVSLRRRADIEEEIADLLYWLLLLSHDLSIDMAQALRQKLAKNEEKYPIELAKGNATKYTRLRP